MLTLFVVILAVTQICLLGIGVTFYVKARRTSKLVTGTLSDIFLPQAEGRSSVAGEAVQEIGEQLAQRIGLTVQQAIKGSIGGSMKGINAALEQEGAAANPDAAILAALPKSLKKNPVALMGLQAIMSKLSGGSSPQASGGQNNGQAKFNL